VTGSRDHLKETIRPFLDLPDELRIAKINSDHWIGYGRALAALDRVRRIQLSERRERPDNLFVVGPSNNGKTMVADRFLWSARRRQDPAAEASDFPAIKVNAPRGPDLTALFAGILKAMGAPVSPRARRREVEDAAQDLVRATRLRILMIDDLHNAFAGSPHAVARFTTQLRLFGDELGVSLVCLGTSDAFHTLRTEKQLLNRFEPFPLPKWRVDDPEYLRLLNSFAWVLPLRRPSDLTDGATATWIMAMAEHRIGEIALILRRAAVLAVREGTERIDLPLLKRIDHTPPSKRDDLSELGIE
jgi:hypothetical protein